MNVKKVLLAVLSLSLLANSAVYAEDLTISGNGEGSTSTVNVSQTQTTNTTQNNTANVDNNVNTTANTGNNEANSNTGGGASITTGDASATTNVTNDNINQNWVDTNNCCNQGGTNVNISGNGENSTNSVGVDQSNTTNVRVRNYANISNDLYGNLNTGYNNANGNTGGDIRIVTGDIDASVAINNKHINEYQILAGSGNGGSLSILVSGNGEGSTNNVEFSNDNETKVDVNNRANLRNNIDYWLNTGHNDANGNTDADVLISTGDIMFQTDIENGPINVGIVDVECCNLPNNPSNPPGSNPPSTSVASSNSSSSSTPAAAVIAAAVLPVTGNYSLALFMIGNILMFFLGGYLRLRSGRSPNYLFAR